MIKLEKLISKFSKEIGLDKNKLLFILLGDQAPKPAEQRPKSHQEGHRLDSIPTGIAAKMAYNNLQKYHDS